MLNAPGSTIAAAAICRAATMVQNSWQEAAWEQMRPSVVFKPKLFFDGGWWCALLGENLQVGVSGFGDSPADAMYAFDKAWTTKIGGPA